MSKTCDEILGVCRSTCNVPLPEIAVKFFNAVSSAVCENTLPVARLGPPSGVTHETEMPVLGERIAIAPSKAGVGGLVRGPNLPSALDGRG